MDEDRKEISGAEKFEEDMTKVTWVLNNFDKLSIEDQLITLSAITEMKNFILPIYSKYHEDILYEKVDMIAQLVEMFKQDKDKD